MNEAQKAAPALAAGNAVSLKPSEETPQLALELVRIRHEAGLPEGLITALPGYGEDVGAAMVEYSGVRTVSFTGGTDTGRAIGAIAGQRLIPVGLELAVSRPTSYSTMRILIELSRASCRAFSAQRVRVARPAAAIYSEEHL